jgi:hypothetical protein
MLGPTRKRKQSIRVKTTFQNSGFSHISIFFLLMWLNTIAVVLCTAYENLKFDEVPVILPGERHGRAELPCLPFFTNL